VTEPSSPTLHAVNKSHGRSSSTFSTEKSDEITANGGPNFGNQASRFNAARTASGGFMLRGAKAP